MACWKFYCLYEVCWRRNTSRSKKSEWIPCVLVRITLTSWWPCLHPSPHHMPPYPDCYSRCQGFLAFFARTAWKKEGTSVSPFLLQLMWCQSFSLWVSFRFLCISFFFLMEELCYLVHTGLRLSIPCLSFQCARNTVVCHCYTRQNPVFK